MVTEERLLSKYHGKDLIRSQWIKEKLNATFPYLVSGLRFLLLSVVGTAKDSILLSFQFLRLFCRGSN